MPPSRIRVSASTTVAVWRSWIVLTASATPALAASSHEDSDVETTRMILWTCPSATSAIIEPKLTSACCTITPCANLKMASVTISAVVPFSGNQPWRRSTIGTIWSVAQPAVPNTSPGRLSQRRCRAGVKSVPIT